MADFNEIQVFGKKTAADLMKEIYESTKKKDKMICSTIDDIKEYIQNIGDAVQLGPMIAQYMDVLVKSDEHMIKLLAIVTKGAQKADAGEDTALTAEEKSFLVKLAQDISSPTAQA